MTILKRKDSRGARMGCPGSLHSKTICVVVTQKPSLAHQPNLDLSPKLYTQLSSVSSLFGTLPRISTGDLVSTLSKPYLQCCSHEASEPSDKSDRSQPSPLFLPHRFQNLPGRHSGFQHVMLSQPTHTYQHPIPRRHFLPVLQPSLNSYSSTDIYEQ